MGPFKERWRFHVKMEVVFLDEVLGVLVCC